MSHALNVDTEHLAHAAHRLEAVATNLEHTVGAHRASLTVTPAGADEVSVTAATSLDESADRFDVEIGKGVAAIRDVAATLRDQAHAVAAHDTAVAGDLFA